MLANIVLDPLDKTLVTRGHLFARYADDFVVMVASAKAGQRVVKSLTRYVESSLNMMVGQLPHPHRARTSSASRSGSLTGAAFDNNWRRSSRSMVVSERRTGLLYGRSLIFCPLRGEVRRQALPPRTCSNIALSSRTIMCL